MPNRIEIVHRAAIVLGALWLIAATAPPHAAGQTPESPSVQPTEPAFVEPLTEPKAVIPPGHEDLLADMLGRGATLAECNFGSGRVENDIVVAAYACPAGEVVVTLRHPTEATRGATLTERFAITVEEGAPPAALMDELSARVRAREAAFEWTWLQPEPGAARSTSWVTFVAIGLLAVGVLWLALRRLRRRTS